MENNCFKFVLNGAAAANIGPAAKEILLAQAEIEYNSNNFLKCIFCQVCALYQTLQNRYYQIEEKNDANANHGFHYWDDTLDWKTSDFNTHSLIQYAKDTLKWTIKNKGTKEENPKEELKNFLQETRGGFFNGIRDIEEICLRFPEEWTILQLCKGPRTETTYSTYPQIHGNDAAIYLTILRHSRSNEYPKPICLRFTSPEQAELFQKFACIVKRFSLCTNVDLNTVNTKETKKKYWDALGELNQYIAGALADLKSFFYPWKFLFTGRPTVLPTKKTFDIVDGFCEDHQWNNCNRVLLSLAAIHVDALSEFECRSICQYLSDNTNQEMKAHQMLLQLKSGVANVKCGKTRKHSPCILIVDERLDHFFWEELNVEQEFSRVTSLHCLYRLYQEYKNSIHNGYLKLNINNGACVVNPDGNLPKMEMRMRQFLKYWTPHWLLKCTEKPTEEEMMQDFFKRPCFIYAGHGSGLQYLNGRNIAKQRINCVVFLFGCDSSRLHSNGLYSELVGTHLYYHAALCPTLVGTIMPALDANMDTVAAEILSSWIAPSSKQIIPWNDICIDRWIKDGVIKRRWERPSAMTNRYKPQECDPVYHSGSLCAILARIHQRISEPKYYNTVSYVCRGLPAWNCDIELI